MNYIDLHLHLDGSLSLKTARQLAEIEKVELPQSDEELLNLMQCPKDCRDLNEYLKCFELPVSLMQSKESLEIAAHNLCADLAETGCIYAEIRFAPQLHCRKGLNQKQVVQSVLKGLKKSSIPVNLILCCMRGNCHKENKETIQLVKKFESAKDYSVVAADLAGAEALFPNENFLQEFGLAQKLGINYVIHAGEASGPESVISAAWMGAYRIGHGVRSIENQDAVNTLLEKDITLEICPTSNLQTKIFNSIEEIPIPQLLQAGVELTINSDNMTVSGTNAGLEMEKVLNTFVEPEHRHEVYKGFLFNALESSFCSNKLFNKLSEQIQNM